MNNACLRSIEYKKCIFNKKSNTFILMFYFFFFFSEHMRFRGESLPFSTETSFHIRCSGSLIVNSRPSHFRVWGLRCPNINASALYIYPCPGLQQDFHLREREKKRERVRGTFDARNCSHRNCGRSKYLLWGGVNDQFIWRAREDESKYCPLRVTQSTPTRAPYNLISAIKLPFGLIVRLKIRADRSMWTHYFAFMILRI